MAIQNRQIGWSQESNLLWQILKQINKLTSVIFGLKEAATPKYKVYTALLTQSGGGNPDSLTSGAVTKGVTYTIVGTEVGDFTNVGAPSNQEGTSFVAINNDVPNDYGNGGLSFNLGAPLVTVLENTIGNIYWTYSNIGYYSANLVNAFPEVKTFILTASMGYDSGVLQAGGGEPYSIYRFSDDQILIAIGSDSNLNNTPIEIRVYN
jgi:hypothetical protein